MGVDFSRESRSVGSAGLRIRLLGRPAISRDGVDVPLPASRKVRALLAYLALAPRGATRTPLCELLWDAPEDPRGELRWCLSKLRRVLDTPDRVRVLNEGDLVRLDLTDCEVDVIAMERAMASGAQSLAVGQARSLVARIGGDFAEGLDIDRSPAFGGWVTAVRRRFRDMHVALLERIATGSAPESGLAHIEQWLQLSPFEPRAHEHLLATLAATGRLREADLHMEAAAKHFASEGLDFAPIRHLWTALRNQPRPGTPERCVGSAIFTVGDDSTAGLRRSDPGRRASVAVMPLRDALAPAHAGGFADALVHDVITRLAKLRSLFVIAQGTVFALAERKTAPDEAARMLDVDYLVSGAVRSLGERIVVSVELTQTRTDRVVWAERFDRKRDETLLVLEELGNGIVACIASEIERVERDRAILRPPNSLDAWESHHRGLWHMYRFTREDNDAAQQFFARAVHLDPTFARAYAGLSFTHWQRAFQGWAPREPEIDRALEAAGQGIMIDDRDPAVHWAQGRALWLRGQHDRSVVELTHAVDLSPNFALGHYALAFVQSQTGDPEAAIVASERSRHLSPYDPLLFGMLGARAMALVRLGRFEEAAEAAVQAAARPNAHRHIFAIAAYTLALAGKLDEAHGYAAAIRKSLLHYDAADFFNAFRFDESGEARFRAAAKKLGMA